jgi:hypothetical protein
MSAFTLAINILPAQEISSPDDLIEVYLENRAVYLKIAPPADETYVQDMRESIFTFDEKAFDSDFLENLTGSQGGDVVCYPVTLAEDPETRDRLIYNSLGELIWRVSAPSSYSPSGPEPGINYPLGADDPARIRIRVTLMTKADKELLDELEAENALAESLVQSFRGDNCTDPFGLWNLWSPATWGVANGVGWDIWDSLNPIHESAGWSGAWEGAKGGAAAWADGVIPLWDPFQDVYADECGNVSGDYKASQFFGGVSRDALLVAAGSGLASRYSSTLANSQRFGKGSQLFGRGGQFGAKGVFNQGPVRTGWGWKGTSQAGRDVFRTSWSKAGSRSYWNHLDWF